MEEFPLGKGNITQSVHKQSQCNIYPSGYINLVSYAYLCAQTTSCRCFYSPPKETLSHTVPSASASMFITDQRMVPLRMVPSPNEPAHG